MNDKETPAIKVPPCHICRHGVLAWSGRLGVGRCTTCGAEQRLERKGNAYVRV